MIIYVCSKNRYRSPIAEFLHTGYSKLPVCSAGVDAIGGEALQGPTLNALERISGQSSRLNDFAREFRTKRVNRLKVSKADVLVAMDDSISEELKDRFPGNKIWVFNPPYGIIDPSLAFNPDAVFESAKSIKNAFPSAPWI